ncbi:hypothetical protein ACS0TY_003926 [Phlomoides rotata]
MKSGSTQLKQLCTNMAIRQMLRRYLSSERRLALSGSDVPKGHLAVYIGENEKKRGKKTDVTAPDVKGVANRHRLKTDVFSIYDSGF